MKKFKEALVAMTCLVAPMAAQAQTPAYGDGLFVRLDVAATGGWVNATANTASGPVDFTYNVGVGAPMMSTTITSLTLQYVNPIHGDRVAKTVPISALNSLAVGSYLNYGVSGGTFYRIYKKPGFILTGTGPFGYVGTFGYALYLDILDPA